MQNGWKVAYGPGLAVVVMIVVVTNPSDEAIGGQSVSPQVVVDDASLMSTVVWDDDPTMISNVDG